LDAICQYDWVTAHRPAPGLFLGVTADLDHPVSHHRECAIQDFIFLSFIMIDEHAAQIQFCFKYYHLQVMFQLLFYY
jgi:hypothetical protein